MPDDTLTADELRAITGKAQPKSQAAALAVPTQLRNEGHGHVVPRPDGAKARCGGPAMCRVCQAEQAAMLAAAQESATTRGRG